MPTRWCRRASRCGGRPRHRRSAARSPRPVLDEGAGRREGVFVAGLAHRLVPLLIGRGGGARGFLARLCRLLGAWRGVESSRDVSGDGLTKQQFAQDAHGLDALPLSALVGVGPGGVPDGGEVTAASARANVLLWEGYIDDTGCIPIQKDSEQVADGQGIAGGDGIGTVPRGVIHIGAASGAGECGPLLAGRHGPASVRVSQWALGHSSATMAISPTRSRTTTVSGLQIYTPTAATASRRPAAVRFQKRSLGTGFRAVPSGRTAGGPVLAPPRPGRRRPRVPRRGRDPTASESGRR